MDAPRQIPEVLARIAATQCSVATAEKISRLQLFDDPTFVLKTLMPDHKIWAIPEDELNVDQLESTLTMHYLSLDLQRDYMDKTEFIYPFVIHAPYGNSGQVLTIKTLVVILLMPNSTVSMMIPIVYLTSSQEVVAFNQIHQTFMQTLPTLAHVPPIEPTTIGAMVKPSIWPHSKALLDIIRSFYAYLIGYSYRSRTQSQWSDIFEFFKMPSSNLINAQRLAQFVGFLYNEFKRRDQLPMAIKRARRIQCEVQILSNAKPSEYNHLVWESRHLYLQQNVTVAYYLNVRIKSIIKEAVSGDNAYGKAIAHCHQAFDAVVKEVEKEMFVVVIPEVKRAEREPMPPPPNRIGALQPRVKLIVPQRPSAFTLKVVPTGELRYVSSGWLMGTSHNVAVRLPERLFIDRRLHDKRIVIELATAMKIQETLNRYIKIGIFVPKGQFQETPPIGNDVGSSVFIYGDYMARPSEQTADLNRLLLQIDPVLAASPGGLVAADYMDITAD